MLLRAAAPLAVAAAAGAFAGVAAAHDWPLPNGTLASTRATAATPISAATVGRLALRWRFRLPKRDADPYAGVLASSPVVAGRTVFVQDLSSSVYALDLDTGRGRWSRRFRYANGGPNGVAVAGGRVVGATDTTAFALSRRTGRILWMRRLVTPLEQFVDVAPLAARGLVFTATIGYPPGGRGALYALDLRTGAVRWKLDTIRSPWPRPHAAGGGGAWYPPSLAPDGTLYAGTANPSPWGGTRRFPNGGLRPGPNLYTDSLLAVGARSGRLEWFDQVTRHDVRDYDLEATPVLATVGGRRLVFGAGKAGRVVAWDRATHRRVWSRAVGTHAHDLGPLPRHPTRVCPGLLGGVETPMAYAAGRLFVPVVDLCMDESGTRTASLLQRDPAGGKGELVALDAATGRKLWTRRLGSPALGCATVARDVVFVASLDGWIRALSVRDGRTLWSARAGAGVNGCPTVAAGFLLVPAGAPSSDFRHPEYDLLAFSLPTMRRGVATR